MVYIARHSNNKWHHHDSQDTHSKSLIEKLGSSLDITHFRRVWWQTLRNSWSLLCSSTSSYRDRRNITLCSKSDHWCLFDRSSKTHLWLFTAGLFAAWFCWYYSIGGLNVGSQRLIHLLVQKRILAIIKTEVHSDFDSQSLIITIKRSSSWIQSTCSHYTLFLLAGCVRLKRISSSSSIWINRFLDKQNYD